MDHLGDCGTLSNVHNFVFKIYDNYCPAPAMKIVTITVVVLPINRPKVVSIVNYCQNTPASQLTATGNNLLWYTTSTGGTGPSIAPTPSTANLGTSNYYVSQTINGVESSRAKITVNVYAIPSGPISY